MVLWEKIIDLNMKKLAKKEYQQPKSESCFHKIEDLFCLPHMKVYLGIMEPCYKK